VSTSDDDVRAAYRVRYEDTSITSIFAILQGSIQRLQNKTVTANKVKKEADRPACQVQKLSGIFSKLLERDVEVEIFLPSGFANSGKRYPLLLLNDGQDSTSMKVKETLEKMWGDGTLPEIIVAGVTAGDRLQEYGVASKSDYQGRGRKAKQYMKYITAELMPYLLYRYPISTNVQDHVIAGYSLGGLSALDIAWNHPETFSKAGVFSGSFWWRKRDTQSRFYSDHRDRLMHLQVRKGKFKPGLQFWFQTGSEDEKGDRNNNGIIDSIDDTLDLIVELAKKGYRPFHDIAYVEIEGGQHNATTWSKAFPLFLQWAFRK
jgi:enterochelin esterase-like enzyme